MLRRSRGAAISIFHLPQPPPTRHACSAPPPRTEKWKKGAAHPDSCSGATVESLPVNFHILVNNYILKDCERLLLRCLAVLRMCYAPTAGLVQRTRERRCSVAQREPRVPARSSAPHSSYLGYVRPKFPSASHISQNRLSRGRQPRGRRAKAKGAAWGRPVPG